MSLLQTIKAAQLQSRKNKDTVTVGLLTTLIGDAEMVGKNNGNRESTDAEVTSTIKKFINNAEETMKVAPDTSAAYQQAQVEIVILKKYLPQQFEGAELERIIDTVISVIGAISIKDMGKVMKEVKVITNGNHDGNVVSAYVRTKLGGN